jgi:hypothetical protein
MSLLVSWIIFYWYRKFSIMEKIHSLIQIENIFFLHGILSQRKYSQQSMSWSIMIAPFPSFFIK